MIRLSFPQLGWLERAFYVDAREDQGDSTAWLTLLPHDESMYDWDFNNATAVQAITVGAVFRVREDLV